MANTVLASTANANMVDRPLWLQAKGGDTAVDYSAQDFRAAFAALVPQEGVLSGGDFAVTQNGGGDGTVNVAAGNAVIIGDSATNLGGYLVRSIGTVNLTVPSAGAGVARVHRVIIRVRDSQLDASTTYDWTLEILEDTGSGTTEPSNAITLALISRTGSNNVVTANIADNRPQAQTAQNGARGIVGGTRYNGGSGVALVGGGGTSEISSNMNTGAVALKANRRYRIQGRVRAKPGTANSILIVRIRDGSTVGTVRGAHNQPLSNTTSVLDFNPMGEYITTIDETKTFYLTSQVSTGLYDLYNGDTGFLCGVWIEDMGPAVPNLVTVV